MAKYRLVEERTKGQDPLWFIEKFGWTLFGKRWYQVSPYYHALSFAEDNFNYIKARLKKFPYKTIIETLEE